MGSFRARFPPPPMPPRFFFQERNSQPAILQDYEAHHDPPPKKNALNKAMLFTCWGETWWLWGGERGDKRALPIEPLFFLQRLGIGLGLKLRSDVNRSKSNISNDTKEYYVPPGLVVEKELSKEDCNHIRTIILHIYVYIYIYSYIMI